MAALFEAVSFGLGVVLLTNLLGCGVARLLVARGAWPQPRQRQRMTLNQILVSITPLTGVALSLGAAVSLGLIAGRAL